MKLLNCSTLKIEEFFGSLVPKSYAILSHRWEADEVTYQDVTNRPETLARRRGWAKIRETCRVALERGHDYAWVDTCCIDKTSSAELTEAINSMFKWYADAVVCFAFLSDMGTGQPFRESLWFTRGWTLQELVAPREILFFDRDWDLVGTRAQLCDVIQERTGVSEKILLHGSDSGPGPRSIRSLLSSIPVAVRMSWAAERMTTREEDRAYSLLGLFGVNMPMLYGEGSGAFMRLQEEIMKQTADLSLFAWTDISGESTDQESNEYRGILAISPDEFCGSGNLTLSRDVRYNPEVCPEYTMTNKGLRIITETSTEAADKNLQILGLGCHDSTDGLRQQVGIYLKGELDVFRRAKPQTLVKMKTKQLVSSRTIYVEKHVETEGAAEESAAQTTSVPGRTQTIRLKILSPTIEVKSAVPASMWDQQKFMFIPDGDGSFAGYIQLAQVSHQDQSNQNRLPGIVACGFDPEGQLWLCPGRRGVHEIYDAAMSGDMKRMQELGIKNRRVRFSETAVKMGGLEAVAVLRRGGFEISIRETTECTIM
ncbi:HET domain-containing protein [Colletotrichum sojae]|uniref:HET domain-containing protein n=1 Tax=Colletotrichum sojae TaxID=2175907 RepID=A0A8H6JCD1_9PEZI|nr:HET domain-containing protein [Colletotrichum sojae]